MCLSNNASEMNLELHVVIIIHGVRPILSTAEVTAATAAAAAVAAGHNTTNNDGRLYNIPHTAHQQHCFKHFRIYTTTVTQS